LYKEIIWFTSCYSFRLVKAACWKDEK